MDMLLPTKVSATAKAEPMMMLARKMRILIARSYEDVKLIED